MNEDNFFSLSTQPTVRFDFTCAGTAEVYVNNTNAFDVTVEKNGSTPLGTVNNTSNTFSVSITSGDYITVFTASGVNAPLGSVTGTVKYIAPATPTPTESPTPTPSETPVPTPTETPAPTPSETPVPTPTETPAPTPSETPVPTPTDTPASTSSPTQTPAPTPSPTPITLSMSPASLGDFTEGYAVNATVTASGGTAPYAYTLCAGSLPAGLSLDGATGVISGTPTASGAYSFSICATDASTPQGTGSKAYSGTVNAPVSVSPASLPDTTINVAYSQTVSATGGTGAKTFSVSSGSLPTGLSLDANTGVISGTPTATGSFSFDITATDTLGATGTKSYSVTINSAISVSPASLPDGTNGAAYSQTVSASNGTGAKTFAVTSGSLPTGLSLDANTGVISGTPSATATYNFDITATDTVGATGVKSYSVIINAGIAISPASLPDTTINVAYSQTVSATGGTGAKTFSVSSGSLPTGLSLDANTGVISGTPTATGSFSFDITATDTLSATGIKSYSVTINAALTVSPATLPDTTINVAYNQTVSASGGTGAKTFAVTSGSLPTGLSLDANTGVISGTPTSAATYSFDITATDTVGATGVKSYSVTINSAISVTPATLPAGTNGTAYSQTVSASNGTGTKTFAVSSGSLPTGLSLDANTGVISGTPSANGTFNFDVTATDTVGATGTTSYSVVINTAISVSPATLPDTTLNETYSQTVTATGGTGAKTFSVSSGSLPTGLSLDANTGVISGTVSAAGTYNFDITATDTLTATGVKSYTVVINPLMTISPATLPDHTISVAYSQTVSKTNGTGAATFAVTSGSLPTGLSITGATGVISGTPSATGTFNFDVTATDTVGSTTTKSYTVVINAAVALSPSTLPNTTQGIAYSQTMTASNGTGAKTFSVSSGSLPTGLSLDANTGVISGTPTTAGTYNFDITATDTVGGTATISYSVVIASTISVSPNSLPDTTLNVAYSQTVSASNGTGAKTFSVSSGSLPTGLSLDANTGVISGTPTAAATYNFDITATDTVGATGVKSYTVVINPLMTISPATLPDHTISVAYNQTVSKTNGTGAATFAVTSGALPTGLTLTGATGVISGTPTATGTFNFDVTATDTVGSTTVKSYSVVINPAISVSPSTLPASTINVAYSQTISATNGTGTKTFSVSSGSLPAGLSLDTNTGVLSGTPTASGTFNFTITATDTVGGTGSQAYSLVINTAISVSPATLPDWTINAASYSQTVSASNGTGSKTFSVSTGSLPTGLSLDANTGVISGTPTTAGTYNFDITATDTVGGTGSQAYTVVINPLMVISPASLPDHTINVAYSQTVSKTNGTGAATFAVTSGSLPTGLTLTGATGVISGTPTATGTFNFDVTATDTVGSTTTNSYTVIINSAVSVSPATLPDTTENIAYSQTVSASNGTGTKTFSISSGSLPTGLSINAGTGVISGTPTTAGTYNFTVTATDSVGGTGSQAYTVVIASPITVSPASLPDSTLNIAYSQTVSASNGTGAKTFSVSAGSLPTGLSLNAGTGVISGNSSAAGTYNFTITATDTVNATGSQAYTVVINPLMVISPASLPDHTISVVYNQTVSKTNGTGAATFAVTSGALPTGLSIAGATGVISGTPTAAGTFNFDVTATDTVGSTTTNSYTVVINIAVSVSPATLPDTTQNIAYNQTVSASNGTGAKTFSISSGSLPTGLSINAGTGVISGTPTTAGTYNFTVTATDSVGGTGSQAYTVVIASPISVTPASLPDTTLNVAYSQTVSASNGTGAKTFAVSSGSLPTGLSLDANTGVISGTPSASGTYNFDVTATDTVTATGTTSYTVVINPLMVISPASLPDHTINVAYSQTVSKTNGTGAATFAVTSGALPTGLSINAGTGVISGTPTATGTFNFDITATDTVGSTTTKSYSIVMNPAIIVSPSTLPDTTINVAYSQTVVATNGTGTKTFSISAGSLPTGLSLNAGTGVISGTPTVANSYNFTVMATDSVGATTDQAYTVVINPAITISPATLPASTQGVNYNQTVAASNGTGTKTFSVSSGTLPAGVTLNATTGVLSGTSTAAGTYNFDITATDTVGGTATISYSILINPPVAVTPASLPDWTINVAYSQTVSNTGGTGASTYAVTSGTLPTGLSLNAVTGVISGTPTVFAVYTFDITATDTVGATGTNTFVIDINPSVIVLPPTLPDDTVNIAYSSSCSASGGTGAKTYAVIAGSLPTGLSLNGVTGAITGTPTVVATYNFTVEATDTVGAKGQQAYTVIINPLMVIFPVLLNQTTAGHPFTQLFTSTGGTGAKSYAITAGALPVGMSMAVDGTLSGTPVQFGTFTFDITVTDSVGSTTTSSYTWVINPPITILPEKIPNTSTGVPYMTTISATGGTGVKTFSLTSGSLPPGLTLNAVTGVIMGTTTSAQQSVFDITATDSVGATATRTYSTGFIVFLTPNNTGLDAEKARTGTQLEDFEGNMDSSIVYDETTAQYVSNQRTAYITYVNDEKQTKILVYSDKTPVDLELDIWPPDFPVK